MRLESGSNDLAEQVDELQDAPGEGHSLRSLALMLDEYMGNPSVSQYAGARNDSNVLAIQ